MPLHPPSILASCIILDQHKKHLPAAAAALEVLLPLSYLLRVVRYVAFYNIQILAEAVGPAEGPEVLKQER